MAKIRQEINILDAINTLAAGFGGTLPSRIQIDTTKYSGTVTYYLEVVAYSSSGTPNLNIALRRDGTSTDDVVMTNTLSTTPARFRSSSFTPPAGATTYTLYSPASITGTHNFKSAKVIVLQDTSTDPLTATETQIEVGNQETGKTNTTVAALTAPKYWYYDSTKWDGTLTFSAEVTYASSSSMDTTTIRLEEDNGSFGGWATIATIVNAGTATSATLVRVSFTPTSGRNYRISTLRSSNMSNHSVYNAKVVVVQEGVIMDEYNATPSTADEKSLSGITAAGVAQSFTGDGGEIAEVRVFLRVRIGSPTGDITAKIYTHSGTFGTSSVPTGAALATSEPIDVTSLTTDYLEYAFVFTVPYSTTASTNYCIGIEYSSGDSFNNCGIAWDSISATHSGNTSTLNTASWSTSSPGSRDLIFELRCPLTKLEPQYLIANTGSFGASTGLKDFDIYYDPAEWDVG